MEKYFKPVTKTVYNAKQIVAAANYDEKRRNEEAEKKRRDAEKLDDFNARKEVLSNRLRDLKAIVPNLPEGKLSQYVFFHIVFNSYYIS